MSALSLVAVPLAFAHFGNPALAGPYAAKLFQLQSWSSLLVALSLLLWVRTQARQAQSTANLPETLLPWLLLAALAALLQEFGVAQRILSARSLGGDLRLWHGLGTCLVLLQWACALRVLTRLASRH